MYATVLDVGASLGRVISDTVEMTQINRWIAAAELILRTRLGDLATYDADIVSYVIVEAVCRKARNPDGKRNERIDDYSYGLNEDAARGEIFITDQEWELLTAGRDTRFSGAFTITLGGG